MQPQTFAIADIMCLITGADFGNGTQGARDLASYLLDIPVDSDHVLDRVRRECIIAMRRQHEGLTFILHPRTLPTREDAQDFLNHMTKVHGHFMEFTPVRQPVASAAN